MTNQRPCRILIVDDDPLFIRSLSRGLKREGNTVECERDGRSALDRLARESFDVVLFLGKPSGADVLQKRIARARQQIERTLGMTSEATRRITVGGRAEWTLQQARTGPLEEAERARIREVLELTGGSRSKAARILGVSRTTLWSRIRKYNLEAAAIQTSASSATSISSRKRRK